MHKVWYNSISQKPKGGEAMWNEMSYNKFSLTFFERLESTPDFYENMPSYYFSEKTIANKYVKKATRGENDWV